MSKTTIRLTKAGRPVFTRNSMTFYSTKITTMVSNLGQRETARRINVPRTTLQGWISNIQIFAEQA